MSLDPSAKQCHVLDEVNVFPVCPQGKWTEYAMGAVAEYVESEDLQLEVRGRVYVMFSSPSALMADLHGGRRMISTQHSRSELNFS